MEIRTIFLLLGAILASSCERSLNLATRYDNTESSKPYQSEEENPDPDIDTLDFTDMGDFLLSETVVVEEPDGTYYAGYWPDGKISVIKNGSSWQIFWCEAEDVLTEGTRPWPEKQIENVKQNNVVFGKGISSIKDFNEDGSWFTGVFPLDQKGHYVGFFHAESHWAGDGTAHKSIGVAYSDDYGHSWRDAAPIITDASPKPESPEWSGLGDGCVIRDEVNGRWICYYQGRVWNTQKTAYTNKLCMAASYDEKGAPGTWKKWDGKDFTIDGCDQETGLGGENIAIANLSRVPGSNPSVMWNSYLKKLIMVYASWTKYVYISYSDDGISWSSPVKIMGSEDNPIWYPNLISSEGDLTGGKKLRMYYSYQQSETTGKRKLGYSGIIFK